MTEEEMENLLRQMIELPVKDKEMLLIFLFHQMGFFEDLGHTYEPSRFFKTVQKYVERG